MVGAERGGEGGAGLDEQPDRPIRVAQTELRTAQGHLHPGHRQRVAGGLPLDLGRRPIQPLAQDRRERLAVLRGVLRVEVLEDRAEDVVHLRHLPQPLLGLTALVVGELLLPPGLDQAEGRADHTEHQRQQHQRRRRHLRPVPPDELPSAGRPPSAGRRRPARG